MKRLVIFSDLDGTLLDYHTYSFAPAQEALQRIARKGIPLILCTSKTHAEILPIRQKLKNYHPFIVENGGAIGIPTGYFPEFTAKRNKQGINIVHIGESYQKVLEILHWLRESKGFRFRGFYDLSVAEIAAFTSISENEAELAKKRQCSEPILWENPEEDLPRFERYLKDNGLKIVKGGRFYQVLGGTDKGKAVGFLIDLYQKKWPGEEIISMGIGDSPNDLDMLARVDIPVIVQRPDGSFMPAQLFRNITYARVKGPAGWGMAVEKILSTMEN